MLVLLLVIFHPLINCLLQYSIKSLQRFLQEPDGMQSLLQTHPTPLTHICFVQQMHLISDCPVTYFGRAATCQGKRDYSPGVHQLSLLLLPLLLLPGQACSLWFEGQKINGGGRGVIHGKKTPMAFAFYFM